MLKKFRTYFITGLLIITPVAVTVFIFWNIFQKLDGLMTGVVNFFVATILGLGEVQWRIPGLGFLTMILLIILTGLLARNYVGRWVIHVGDRVITQIPLISKIYVAIQQILQTLFAERTEAFRKAVLIEYPRKGIYCIAFFTQETEGEIREQTNTKLVGVFVPTTPNPTSGFLLFVPKEDVIELDMSIEEALKLVISGGIISPNKDNLKRRPPIPPSAEPRPKPARIKKGKVVEVEEGTEIPAP